MHIHSALVFATMYAVPFLHIILIPRVIVPPMGLLKRGMNAGAWDALSNFREYRSTSNFLLFLSSLN